MLGYDDQELKLEIPNQQYAAKSTSRDYSKWGGYNVNRNGVCVFVVLICIVCRLNNSGNYILLGRRGGREGEGRWNVAVHSSGGCGPNDWLLDRTFNFYDIR